MQTVRLFLDVTDTVVEVVNLTIPSDFAKNGIFNKGLVILGNVGDNRKSFFWRGINLGEVPDSRERKMQCAGNRSSRKGEDVNIFRESPQFFLVNNPKALFLVNN